METTWKERKMTYLKKNYGWINEWSDESDDRYIAYDFIRCMYEALDSLPDTPNLYVRVAMSETIGRDLTVVDQIIKEFAGEDHKDD